MWHEETLGSELSIERTVTTDLTGRSLFRVSAGRRGHLLGLQKRFGEHYRRMKKPKPIYIFIFDPLMS